MHSSARKKVDEFKTGYSQLYISCIWLMLDLFIVITGTHHRNLPPKLATGFLVVPIYYIVKTQFRKVGQEIGTIHIIKPIASVLLYGTRSLSDKWEPGFKVFVFYGDCRCSYSSSKFYCYLFIQRVPKTMRTLCESNQNNGNPLWELLMRIYCYKNHKTHEYMQLKIMVFIFFQEHQYLKILLTQRKALTYFLHRHRSHDTVLARNLHPHKLVFASACIN